LVKLQLSSSYFFDCYKVFDVKLTYKILIANSIIVSLGTLVMRYGGRKIDWSARIMDIISQGRLWFLGIFICWIGGLIFSLAISRTEASLAVAFNSALVFVFVFLGGVFFLKENFSLMKCIGSLLIICGIIFMSQD
jgi:drug/metabolite transporter (DMT)-like permease